MAAYWREVWIVLLELAPWLLLGLGVAGALHVLVPRDFVERHLGRRGPLSVVKAAVLGVPMPLCSCSVIPAGIGLRQQGASDGASLSFLISTPQTGVDSVMVSASFLGWPFAIFKLASAFVTGIVGGLAGDLGGGSATGPATLKETAAPEPSPTAPAPTNGGRKASWQDGLRYLVDDLLRMIWLWLIFGVLVSAAISTWVEDGWFRETALASGPLAMLATLAISVPLYVCATSSVPIAAALVEAGLPTSAALVFLMAGPATNVATLGAVYRAFGKRLLAIYVLVVAGGSMLLGWLFEGVVGRGAVTEHTHEHVAGGPVATAAAVVLLLLFGRFAVQDLCRLLGNLRTSPPAAERLEISVAGMTCQGCVRKLHDQLAAIPNVTDVSVDLEMGRAVVAGSDLQEDTLAAGVRAAGFTPASFQQPSV